MKQDSAFCLQADVFKNVELNASLSEMHKINQLWLEFFSL